MKNEAKTIARALVVLPLLAWAGCEPGESPAQATPVATPQRTEVPLAVELLTAGAGASAGTILAQGTLEPLQQTPVGSKEGGIVAVLKAEVGDRVTQGQPLLQLESTDHQQALQLAELGVQAARLSLESAERDLQRYTRLQQEGSIPQADFEKVTLAHKGALLGVRQAETQRTMARTRLANTTVRAPFAGQIVSRTVSLGSYVDSMTHPVLFVLLDTSRLKAALELPELRAALVSPGDPVEIRVPALGRTLRTTVTALVDSSSPTTHTRTAIAWIENSGPDPLPGGLFFEATVTPASLKEKVVLPANAVRESAGTTSVFVVQGQQARARPVQGRFLADRGGFLVEQGLNQGEQVVAEASLVRDGQLLLTGAPAPAATPAKEAVLVPESRP